MPFIPSPSFATSSAQAQALNVEIAVQEFLGTVIQEQERAVNAGHHPSAVVDYVLDLERQKARVTRTTRSFINILRDADRQVAKLTEELRN